MKLFGFTLWQICGATPSTLRCGEKLSVLKHRIRIYMVGMNANLKMHSFLK